MYCARATELSTGFAGFSDKASVSEIDLSHNRFTGQLPDVLTQVTATGR